MTDRRAVNVRSLAIGEVDAYLRHVAVVDAGSGVDGAGHSHPYRASDPFDVQAGREREVARWSTEIDDPEWRRVWGLFDREELVGHLYLAGGTLPTELHRVQLGMGVVISHRRMGGGTSLMEAAIGWARSQPNIIWIDLNVFADNPGARTLYARHGFQVLGRTPDRFRVDGQSLDDTWMALNVAAGDE
jgi:RimJ/RimL family protein N-acetyltransferase